MTEYNISYKIKILYFDNPRSMFKIFSGYNG